MSRWVGEMGKLYQQMGNLQGNFLGLLSWWFLFSKDVENIGKDFIPDGR